MKKGLRQESVKEFSETVILMEQFDLGVLIVKEQGTCESPSR